MILLNLEFSLAAGYRTVHWPPCQARTHLHSQREEKDYPKERHWCMHIPNRDELAFLEGTLDWLAGPTHSNHVTLLCSNIIFYVFNIVDLFMYWLKITYNIMYVIVIWKMPISWEHGLCLHAERTYVRACACSQGVGKVVWVPAPSLIREEGSGTLLRTPQYLCMVRQLSVKLSSLCICAMLMCNLLFHFQCNQL